MRQRKSGSVPWHIYIEKGELASEEEIMAVINLRDIKPEQGTAAFRIAFGDEEPALFVIEADGGKYPTLTQGVKRHNARIPAGFMLPPVPQPSSAAPTPAS